MQARMPVGDFEIMEAGTRSEGKKQSFLIWETRPDTDNQLISR